MTKRRLSPKLAAVISSIILVLLSGTFIFRALEDWTWVQSFYFTVVTVTTVGYGDLHPTSDESRLIASFFILVGVSILIMSISYFGGYFARLRLDKLSRNKDDDSK